MNSLVPFKGKFNERRTKKGGEVEKKSKGSKGWEMLWKDGVFGAE